MLKRVKYIFQFLIELKGNFMTKVLMLTGDGGESLEVMYPYQRLQEEGYEVDIAAPSKKMIQTVVHDFVPGFDTYTEKLGYLVKADLAFSEVNPEEYSALVIPGGRAPEYIRNDLNVQKIVLSFSSYQAIFKLKHINGSS